MTLDPTAVNRTLPGPSGGQLTSSSYTAGSSEWWIERMSKRLVARQRRFEMLDAYYRGTQKLSTLSTKAWRESEVSSMFPEYLSANHAKLIVNAAAGRLVVLGFRLAGDATDADDEAGRIWAENEMEAESEKAITESLVKGECPVLVEPNPRDPMTPLITPQQPDNVIVMHSAGDHRIRLAAMKTWWDDDARRRLYILYFPDRIEYWQDRQPNQMDWFMNSLFAQPAAQWERRIPRGKSFWRETNPLGEVPVIVLPNDPRLAGSPEGEHEAVLSRIDHYNKTLMDMAVTSHELAYPQRFASGVENAASETKIDPLTGAEVTAPSSDVQTGQTRWITVPSPDATFGQFAAATLDQYVKALDQIRGDIATDSFTPYHFLLNMPTSVPPSGESITAAETALVDKCEGHQRDKGMGLRNVMRLAFLVVGDKDRAQAMRHGEVIWKDAERRTESQHVDALSKLAADPIGVPQQAIWEMSGATPTTIKRWRRMKEAAPAPTPAAEGAPVGTNEPNGLDNQTPTGAT